jgi:hypothetical protein
MGEGAEKTMLSQTKMLLMFSVYQQGKCCISRHRHILIGEGGRGRVGRKRNKEKMHEPNPNKISQ